MKSFVLIFILACFLPQLKSQMYVTGPAIPTYNNEQLMFFHVESQEWYISIYIDADQNFEDIGFRHYPSGSPVNIGGTALPAGIGTVDGPLFILPHSGFYLIKIKESTYEYSISDGSTGINTLDPDATLEVFGGMFSTAHYIQADSTHINLPQNLNTVIITGNRPDSVIVNLYSSFADGQRILIQNWCFPKAVVPLSSSSVTIYPGECAEFLNTSYSGITNVFNSRNLRPNEVWLTSGNSGTYPGQDFIGTRDSIDLIVKTNNQTRMVFTAGGSLGVGIQNPVGKLEIHHTSDSIKSTLNLVDSVSGNTSGATLQFSNLFSYNRFRISGNIGSGIDGSNSFLNFIHNGTSIMSLRGDGNLGIGVLDPLSRISVASPFGNQLSLQNINPLENGINSTIHFGGSNYTTGLISTLGQSSSNARMGFFTGYSFSGGPSFLLERLSISNEGKIGIGTSSPMEKLDIHGSVKLKDGNLKIFEGSENTVTVSSTGSIKAKGKVTVGDDVETPQAGAMRWNAIHADFEGFTGTEWVSLTKKSQGWGHEVTEYSTLSLPEIDTAGLHYYGRSVDIFEDRVIVGAPAKDVGSNVNQGKAYIFIRDGNDWVLEDTLTASDGDAFDFFGVSVSMSGDYAMVGASSKQIGANENQGKVYFFKRTGNDWVEEYNQAAPDGHDGDYFGSDVCLYGDYAVVGAPWKDLDLGNNFQNEHGKIYIYHRSGISWLLTNELTSPDNQPGDRFGFSVSLDSLKMICSSPFKDNGGKVYILERSGVNWNHTASFSSADIEVSDRFGVSVDLYKSTVIVGAHGKYINGISQAGKAYIFRKNGANWTEEAGLVASDASTKDLFGFHVDIYENYAIVGAPYNNNSTFKPGKAFIYTKSGTAWLEAKKLIPSQSQNGDEFGEAVAISVQHAFVGASRYNNLQGKVFYFKK